MKHEVIIRGSEFDEVGEGARLGYGCVCVCVSRRPHSPPLHPSYSRFVTRTGTASYTEIEAQHH